MGCDLYIGRLVMHRRARRGIIAILLSLRSRFPGTRKNGSCFGRIHRSLCAPVGPFTRPRRSVNKITTARVFSQTRARIFFLHLYVVGVAVSPDRKRENRTWPLHGRVLSRASWNHSGPSICLSGIPSISHSCEIVLPR